jgi:hypothetical protein
MATRWALIEKGVVVNIVKWNGDVKTWRPKDGQTAIPADNSECTIGATYDGKVFTRPVPVEVPKVKSLEERLTEVETELENWKKKSTGGAP